MKKSNGIESVKFVGIFGSDIDIEQIDDGLITFDIGEFDQTELS